MTDPLEGMTWQSWTEDDWVFGVPVRGIIRHILAQVYFDEDQMSRRGGWMCRVFRGDPDRTTSTQPNVIRAVTWCENKLRRAIRRDRARMPREDGSTGNSSTRKVPRGGDPDMGDAGVR